MWSFKACGFDLACKYLVSLFLYSRDGVELRPYLLQNALHDRVADNADDFGVLLDPLHCLLFSLTLSGRVHGLHAFPCLLFNLPGVLPFGVRLSCLVASIQTLVVLLHGIVNLCLPDVCTHELLISFQGFVAVLDRLRERKQFDQRRSTVRVTTGVLGGTLDHLGVSLDSSNPVRGLETSVSFFTGLVCLLRVDVGLPLKVDLGLLGGTKLAENIRGTVLCKSTIVVFNGLCEVTLLLVRGSNTAECPESNLG